MKFQQCVVIEIGLAKLPKHENLSASIGEGILRKEIKDFRAEGISKTLSEFSTLNFVGQNLTGNRNRGKLALTRFNTSQWQIFGSLPQNYIVVSKLSIGKIIVDFPVFTFFLIFGMLMMGVVVISGKPVTDRRGSAQWVCILLCRLFPVRQRV